MRGIALVAVALVGASGLAQGLPRNFGLRAGVYIPAEREIRDLFGEQILSVGFGSVSGSSVRDGRLSPSVSVIRAERNGNHIFLVPVALTYERTLGDARQNVVPYARVGAGIYYADYGISRTSTTRESGKRVGSSLLGELGVTIARRARVGARYYQFSEVDRFKFSGVEVFASVDLFRW